MDKQITVKTTDPVKLDLPLNLNSYMSEIRKVVLGEDKFFGNIYAESEEELNNIRKVFESIPELLEFVEVWNRFRTVPLEDRIKFTTTHKRMEELYDKLKDLV